MTEPQVTYSDGAFASAFDTFETLLADFGTITLALDAYESNKDWHHESTMGPECRTQLSVGETNSFSLTFVTYDYEFDDEDAARKHWEDERSGWTSFAQGWASEKVAGLRPRFATIVDPWPDHLTTAASQFEDIRTVLGTQVSDDFAGLEYSQSHWEGETASAFFTNFYNQFPQCVINLAWVAEMLQNACAAGKGVVDMGRMSAMNTVSAMVARVEDALRARQDAHSIDATEWLTIATTVLDLLDLLPIAIPDSLEKYAEKFEESTGDFRAGAAAALGYATDAIPEASTSEQQAQTQRPEGIVSDFHTAIDTIHKNLESAWAEVETQYVAKVDANISELEALRLLWLPRPDLAGSAGSPGDFHHSSSNQYT